MGLENSGTSRHYQINAFPKSATAFRDIPVLVGQIHGEPMSLMALLSTMFVLAIIPSPSVFAVIARSITSGFIHGVITTVGIIAGDFIFILLAMLGVWTLAETMASVFFLLKYLGSAYLIYLGHHYLAVTAQGLYRRGHSRLFLGIQFHVWSADYLK